MLLSVATISLVAVAADNPTPAAGPSGIEGVILVSPVRPGPIRRDSPGPAPAGNIPFVIMKAEERVSSFTTDPEGRFRVQLPPGHYTVLREDPGSRIGHWRFDAEVKPGEMLAVRWVGDSGMR